MTTRNVMSLLAGVLCLLAVALFLTSCGGGSGSGSGGSSAGADVWEVSDVQAVADAGAFSEELGEIDSNMVFMLYHLSDYGISEESLKECSVIRSSGATCEEMAVLIFEWPDDQAADAQKKVQEALQAYVDGEIEANQDYRPQEIPKLEDALISQKGNTFLLLVANDMDAANGALS